MCQQVHRPKFVKKCSKYTQKQRQFQIPYTASLSLLGSICDCMVGKCSSEFPPLEGSTAREQAVIVCRSRIIHIHNSATSSSWTVPHSVCYLFCSKYILSTIHFKKEMEIIMRFKMDGRKKVASICDFTWSIGAEVSVK